MAITATLGDQSDKPADESAEPIVSHPERVYVYELDAEVRPPLDLESEPSIGDIVLDHVPQRAAATSAHRAIDDEPLFFEVTEAGLKGTRLGGKEAETEADASPGAALPKK